MSFHVRNPSKKSLRDLQLAETSGYEFMPGNTKRITDTSKDSSSSRLSNDENDTSSTVTYEEVAFQANPNQPVVIYSKGETNYPISYSCEHSLFYTRNGHDENFASAAAMLSHSEDDGNDEHSIALNDASVRIALEFEIPLESTDGYEEVISNVEALQWSVLNKVAVSTGLSKGCKIENQYDERTLVTALTNINDRHSSFTDANGNQRYSNSGKNRRRAREAGTKRELLATLPYPTSVYSVASTRPKWTAFCSTRTTADNESETSKCFTAEINFDVKYRGSAGESNIIEDYVQSIVHNQIALDDSKLYVEDITGLRWISKQQASALFDSDQATLTPVFGPNFSLGEGESASNDESRGFIANLVIPLVTVALIGLIWFCIHFYDRKKRRSAAKRKAEKQKRTEGRAGAEGNNDIETGSVSTGQTRDLQSKDSKDSIDSQESQEASKSCTEAMVKAVGLSTAASSVLQGDASSNPPIVRSLRSRPVSVDSPGRSGLPPRPVTAKRTVSMPLKKKRRKKRKKKKQVLSMTRVSSRDNIVEMPMISESESECDSDSGDEEYYDDGSSYDASSGCSSPGRRSRSSSRASSPQKSPRDDGFPPESADQPDFEFVMEAPEFSEDLFATAHKFSEDLFASEAGKNEVVGVDENLPPNLTLRPRVKPEEEDVKQPLSDSGNANKDPAPVVETVKDRRPLEVDTSVDSNDSFNEENGNVMERMLPLPWLNKNNNNKNTKRVK